MNANNANSVHALLLTPRETARALAISERKLWSLTKDGAIPHVKIGRSVRYPADKLREWLVGQMRGGDA